MDTGRSINSFDIADVSEGCNYSDDILAVTKKQSPNAMNVEFFNGRIRKRPGELAFTTTPAGQGGIDAYTKLMLHAEGTDAAKIFTDSESTPKIITSTEGYDTHTLLMLQADGVDSGTVFTDSATGKTIVAVGNAQTKTAIKKFGTASAHFDGTNSQLTTSSSDFEWGTNATLDFWVYPTSIGGVTPQYLWCQGPISPTSERNGVDITQTDGYMEFTAVDSTGTFELEFYVATPMPINVWTHVAIVKSGTNWYMFFNGVQQTLVLGAGSYSNSITTKGNNLFIGSFQNNTDYFNGYLDGIRFSNVARWTSNFTLMTYPFGFAVTSTAQKQFGSSSVFFDGVGGHLTASSSDFEWGLTQTLDFWVNPTSLSHSIIWANGASSANTNYVSLSDTNSGDVAFTAIGSSSTEVYFTTPGGVISANVWTHVAIVRNSSNWFIFINGVAQTLTLRGGVYNATVMAKGNALYIGGEVAVDLLFYAGYLDEIRWSNLVRWEVNFTPPALSYDNSNASVPSVGFSIFDFSDVNSHHKQISHLGSVVYAYDQVTSSKVLLRNGAPYTRSFNANIGGFFIQTYNDYSVPYYWDGAAASMAILSANAPGFKRAIEFQGYLLGMNTSAHKTRCYYQLIGNIIGGGAAYTDFFTLTPAPNDDEITDPFILNGRLYAGTKYGIFRISFVGGVTVFEFKQAVSIVGIVPKTTQVVVTRDFGQVAIFLGTDKRLYLFDGANVKAISDLFYYHNQSTAIAMDLIDDNYKENCFAVYDITRRIYRLWITKKSSSTNYYCINVEVETFAYYPFDNMQFSSGAICYDALLRPFVVCIDYTGSLHKMFIENNTDNGTAINEYYESPIVSLKNSAVKQAQTLTLNMRPSSNANLLVYEKVDFKRAWTQRASVPCASSRDKFLGQSLVLGSAVLGSEKDIIYPQIGLATSFNYYQFKLVSDTAILPPWEIIDITFDESLLKFGRAEAQR